MNVAAERALTVHASPAALITGGRATIVIIVNTLVPRAQQETIAQEMETITSVLPVIMLDMVGEVVVHAGLAPTRGPDGVAVRMHQLVGKIIIILF